MARVVINAALGYVDGVRRYNGTAEITTDTGMNSKEIRSGLGIGYEDFVPEGFGRVEINDLQVRLHPQEGVSMDVSTDDIEIKTDKSFRIKAGGRAFLPAEGPHEGRKGLLVVRLRSG